MGDSSIERMARRIVGVERQVKALRTPQLPLSTVTLPDGSEQPIADAVATSAETAATLDSTVEQLGDVDQASDTTVIDGVDILPWIEGGSSGADVSFRMVVDAARRVTEAQQEALAAAQAAANAQTTADGKNSRRRGVAQPEPPEGGWVPGDQWVRDVLDPDGVAHPVEVLVWNGSTFASEQLLTSDLFVFGPDGLVRIRNGAISAEMMSAAFFYGREFFGGRFVGGEFIQEASDDLAAFYPEVAGEVVPADWAGGAPDGWGPVGTSTSVKDTGTMSVTAARAGAGSLSALWTNHNRVPVLSSTPRGLEFRVRVSNAVSGVHVSWPGGGQSFANITANTWVSLIVDLPDDVSLEWAHVGVTTTTATTLYVDQIRVLAPGVSGAYLAITRSGGGVPGLFIFNGDGQLLGDFTPAGLRSFQPDGEKSAALLDGDLKLTDSFLTPASAKKTRTLQVTAAGIETSYGTLGNGMRGTTAQREALQTDGLVKEGMRFFDETVGIEYVFKGGRWRPTVWSGVLPVSTGALSQIGTSQIYSAAFTVANIPVDLVAGERIRVTPLTIGSGWGDVTQTGGSVGPASNPCNATVRFKQAGSSTAQSFTMMWEVVTV